MKALLAALLPVLVLFAAGCWNSHCSPGADFDSLGIRVDPIATDPAVADSLGRRPGSSFPAVIAAMRVQGNGFDTGTGMSTWGRSDHRAVVVTRRDVETQDDFDRLAKLSFVSAVVPVNGLAVPTHIRNESDLRAAAGFVHADLLLLYTLDTRWTTETTIPLVGGLTLGAFPNRSAHVTTTAAAAILDVRTGYVYTLAEATNHQEQIANSWTSDSAVDQSRRRAERKAFEGLLDSIEKSWPRVTACACPYAAPSREYVLVPALPPPAPVRIIRPTEDGWDQVPRGMTYRTR